MYLSVVIPVFNEEESITLLLASLEQILMQNQTDFEILVIDDGSSDLTREKVKKYPSLSNNIKLIGFRKNFGKSAALMAGFREAKGEIVITMDGDLQDEPKEIFKLIEKIEEGFDLVSGWKKLRQDPLEKVIASRIFNFFISRMLGVKLHDFNCGFKAYRSWCLKDIRLSGNLYRFLPVFVHKQGGKVTEIPVQHNPRKFGISKFGYTRYFHGIIDSLTVLLLLGFFYKPLYFFGLIAAPFLFVGSSVMTYLLGSHFLYWITSDLQFQLINRPMLFIGLGSLGLGVNIFLVGLLAELIVHVSSSTQSQYFYSVEDVIEVQSKSPEISNQ